MKKKILSFLLTICFVLPSVLFMTACDKSGDPENPPENPPADAPATPPTTTPGGVGPEEDAEFVYEISEDGKYVYFGEFPQTIKADNVTILSEPPDSNGYYLGRDGERYCKYTVNIDYDALGYNEEEAKALKQTTLSNGYEFSNGETLYFKVEKIKWRILENEDGEYLLMCDSILQGMAYQPNYQFCNNGYYVTDQYGQFLYEQDGETMIQVNNYKYSALRKFLTTDFYNVAFKESQKAIIKLTEVDNSAETTNNPTNNIYACENTNDYVFALSYADMINTEYGFDSVAANKDINRTTCPTDFAKATGAMTYTVEMLGYTCDVQPGDENWEELYAPYIGTGVQWLRSPSDDSTVACHVLFGCAGSHENALVDNPDYGACPALRIRLP